MSRFQLHRRNKLNSYSIGVILFAAILFFFIQGISYVDSTLSKQQETALINALERNIVHCYTQEGFYPPSLSYMEEHYGLTYDKNMFLVDYQPIGNNIYPDFTVIRKGDTE